MATRSEEPRVADWLIDAPANDAPDRHIAVIELDDLPEAEGAVWLPTDLIDAGPRMRAVDEVWADALGELMKRGGQGVPIDVCRADHGRWELHGAGGHRLRGAQIHAIECMKVLVWPRDDDAAELREIRDGLQRRDLAPYDRATMFARSVDLIKRKMGVANNLDGRSASAHARWQKGLREDAKYANDTMSLAYGWSTQLADQLGFNKRTIERDLLLHRRLSPSLVARLHDKRHPILANATQLGTLAKLDERAQSEAVAWLTGDDGREPVKSLGDALARMRGANRAPSDPGAKRLSTFIGTFQRMGLAEKKGALVELAPLLPADSVLAKPAPQSAATGHYLQQVKDGLNLAFDLLLKLSDGEPVDDDEINVARSRVQMALFAVNGGEITAADLAEITLSSGDAK